MWLLKHLLYSSRSNLGTGKKKKVNLFWNIIKTKKDSRKTQLTKSQVNTDLKLLWQVVMTSHNCCNFFYDEWLHFDKRIHFTIKQFFKMFCFGASHIPHLYHKTHCVHASQLSVIFRNLFLLISLPIGPWGPIIETMLVNTNQVVPWVNTGQVSCYLEWTTTASLAPTPSVSSHRNLQNLL